MFSWLWCGFLFRLAPLVGRAGGLWGCRLGGCGGELGEGFASSAPGGGRFAEGGTSGVFGFAGFVGVCDALVAGDDGAGG